MRFNLKFTATLFAISFLITSCSSTPPNAVSEEGRKACMEEVASSMLNATQLEKQKKFRECLHTIDARLEALQEESEREAQAKQAYLIQRQQQQAATWAPPAERLNHCKLVQEEVIQLDKDRIRAYARLVGSSSNNSTTYEIEQYERDYDDVIRELDQRIPARIRANWELVPDAVERFKRCDPRDFLEEPE